MKVIIIGASSGIGIEMALLYAKAGHSVGITGRRNALLAETKAAFPQTVITSCYDVMSAENIPCLQKLIDDLGGMDLLVYNAGTGEPTDELISEIELTTTKTNALAFVEVAAFAFNFFVRQGHGRIAVTSSVAALRGNGFAPAYSASKAFVSNYAEGLNLKAKRLKKNIVVTDIRPGFVDTKMARGNARFWVASPRKAATQIFSAIEKRKRVAYVTKRWWLVAQVFKRLPFWIYKRIG